MREELGLNFSGSAESSYVADGIVATAGEVSGVNGSWVDRLYFVTDSNGDTDRS